MFLHRNSVKPHVSVELFVFSSLLTSSLLKAGCVCEVDDKECVKGHSLQIFNKIATVIQLSLSLSAARCDWNFIRCDGDQRAGRHEPVHLNMNHDCGTTAQH